MNEQPWYVMRLGLRLGVMRVHRSGSFVEWATFSNGEKILFWRKWNAQLYCDYLNQVRLALLKQMGVEE